MAHALKKRLDKIAPKDERKLTVLSIRRDFIDPNDLSKVGEYFSIIGGSKFYSDDFETEEEFKKACNDEHIRVHGTPICGEREIITIGGD